MGVDITSSILYGIKVPSAFFEVHTPNPAFMVRHPLWGVATYDPTTGARITEYLSTKEHLVERLNRWELADEYKLDIVDGGDGAGPYYIGRSLSRMDAKYEGGAKVVYEPDKAIQEALTMSIMRLCAHLKRPDPVELKLWHLVTYS